MTTILQTMVSDMESSDLVLPGFVLERTQTGLTEALEHQGEQALEQACAFVETLYDRVLSYHQDLANLDVPAQEEGRHHQLMGSFSVYSEALLHLLDALCGEQEFYDPQMLTLLGMADECLRSHQAAARKGTSLSALL